jgi:sirohydrochlorin ferrochelatase
MSDHPSLLLIGHGSRSEAGVAQFWQFVDVLQLAAPQLQIAAGFIEFAEPTLDDAIDTLVSDGATSVVAVPLVLLGAGHMKDDGPACLRRARERHPFVTFSYARDLGVHPSILAVVEDRARASLRRPRTTDTGSAQAFAVVLVGRGSTDPDANSDLYKASRLLAEHRHLTGDTELDEVQPAFVSLAPPSVPVALERAATLGATQIAVVPYFLFTGVLVDRIVSEAEAWAAGHPGVTVTMAPEMGPDRRIAELVLERFAEACGHTVLMNCDACLYRIPLPGATRPV